MTEPSQIYADMASIMQQVQGISKDQRNKSQGFNYRGIDDVYNAIQPIMAKHGVFCALNHASIANREERTTKNGGVLYMTTLHLNYRFYAKDGSFVQTEVIGEGMDSADKASNKAMAVGHKYAIMQAFCIPTQDMPDPDSETLEPQPKPPAKNQMPAALAKIGKEFVEAAQVAPNLNALEKHLETNGYNTATGVVADGSNLYRLMIFSQSALVRCLDVAKARQKQLTEAMNDDDPFVPNEREAGQEG